MSQHAPDKIAALLIKIGLMVTEVITSDKESYSAEHNMITVSN